MVVKIWACHFDLSLQSSRWLPMFHWGHACFIFRVTVTIETAGSPTPLVTTTKTTQHHHSENHTLRNSKVKQFRARTVNRKNGSKKKLPTSRNFIHAFQLATMFVTHLACLKFRSKQI